MIDAVHSILVEDAQFVVQPAGRAKVLKEQRKNVHSFVRGTRVNNRRIKVGQQLNYNPYKMGAFYYKVNGRAIYEAELVVLADNQVWLAEYI